MKFTYALLIGICLPVLLALVFVVSGGLPVATKGPPLPFERWIAGVSIRAAMKDAVKEPSPITADETNLVAGAHIYLNHCAVCHGIEGQEPTFIAKGLFPKPPQLFRADRHGVTDDPIGETFWKIKNGIRLTGMPGFVDNLSDTEMWQVSELLLNAHQLSASVKQVLQSSRH